MLQTLAHIELNIKNSVLRQAQAFFECDMDQIAETFSAMLRTAITPDSRVMVDTKESSLLDACGDCIKVISTSGKLMYMNRAGCDALCVDPRQGFGMPWVPLLHPDIHAPAFQAISDALTGIPARFQGLSGSGDDLIHWDNLLTPMPDENNRVRAILCVSRDMTEQTKLKESLKRSIEREQILAQEMRHRVKNLFAVVSGLIVMSQREFGPSEEVKTFSNTLRGRILAFARASETLFSAGAGDDDLGDLEKLVRAVLEPYAGQITIVGPRISLCPNNLTTIALIFHELATNAMKHGALRSDQGSVKIGWERDVSGAIITWEEHCAEPVAAPTHHGFGTSIIERSISGIGGSIVTNLRDTGIHSTLRLPLDNTA